MMRRTIVSCALAAASAIGLAAQDNTTRSRTKVQTDEAAVFSMTGCLRQGPSGAYMLIGTLAQGGDDLRTSTKVRTDVDRDDTEVKATTRTKTDDGAVATTGAVSTFALMPPKSVNMAPHVGRQVQISAVMVDPDHRDADVKIEEKTTVDPDRGRDTTRRSRTKIEVERGAPDQYTVVSVTPLGASCTP
jgi:hypothetical protein